MSNTPPYNPYQSQVFYPNRRDPEQVRQRVRPAGVALLIVGTVGSFLMFCYLAFSLVMIFSGVVKLPQNANAVNNAGFWFGVSLPHLAYLFNALANVFVAYAGFNMMNLRNYTMSMMGAIAALIPCFSPCCIAGIPFGIWCLVVLTSEGAKDAFQ